MATKGKKVSPVVRKKMAAKLRQMKKSHKSLALQIKRHQKRMEAMLIPFWG